MKGRRTRGILFIFWILLATISILWVLFSIFMNINLILSELMYQFVFLVSWLLFIISAISLHGIMAELKSEINMEKEKQKSVQEYYQYTQLLDPPTMNN